LERVGEGREKRGMTEVETRRGQARDKRKRRERKGEEGN